MPEPYRDEASCVAERIRRVEEELGAIELAAARKAELERETAQLRKRYDRAHGPLGKLRMASPCAALWHDMEGDDRVRGCRTCKQKVFNVAGMSSEDARSLVDNHAPDQRDVRRTRRADGTVLIGDCPVGTRRRRLRMAIMALVAIAGGVAIGFWFRARSSTWETEEPLVLHRVMRAQRPFAGRGAEPTSIPPPHESESTSATCERFWTKKQACDGSKVKRLIKEQREVERRTRDEWKRLEGPALDEACGRAHEALPDKCE